MPTIVIVTASNEQQAEAVEHEIQSRVSGRGGPWAGLHTFVVPDPSNARVGSGGATFNALITVQDLLSLRRDIDLLNSRVFIIHSGGDSQRLPCQSVCGKAWSSLPAVNKESQNIEAPIDLLLATLLVLFADVTSGVIIASSDVLLDLDESAPVGVSPTTRYVWPDVGATGLAFPAHVSYGPHHGAYTVKPDEPGATPSTSTNVLAQSVHRFFQKASVEELTASAAVRPDNTVLIDTGVIYFSKPAVATLLTLARTLPLSNCTYLGLDSGLPALRVELYSDIMLAMGYGLGRSFDAYAALPTADLNPDTTLTGRKLMWDALFSTPFHALVVERGRFYHVGTTSEYLTVLTQPSRFRQVFGLEAVVSLARLPAASSTSAPVTTWSEPVGDAEAVCLNSLLSVAGSQGKGSIVEHCNLQLQWTVAPGALASGVRSVSSLAVLPRFSVQELHLSRRDERAITVLHVDDTIKTVASKADARVFGVSWDILATAAGVSNLADLWPAGTQPNNRTIWNAELFPVIPTRSQASITNPGVEDVQLEAACLWMQYLAYGDGAAPTEWPWPSCPLPTAASTWKSTRRISLQRLLAEADADGEFRWRRELRGLIDVESLVQHVTHPPMDGSSSENIASLLRRLTFPLPWPGSKPFIAQALDALDGLAGHENVKIGCRALSVCSALLWQLSAWGSEALASGPGSNPSWARVYSKLKSSEPTVRREAVQDLANLRTTWLKQAHGVGRAARHYENAAKVMIAHCVYTAPVSAPQQVSGYINHGAWVLATAPARIDLAGGWSDTPPLTFEASSLKAGTFSPASINPALAALQSSGGGAVANVAVTIDGKRPVGSRARRIAVSSADECKLVIRARGGDWSSAGVPTAVTSELVLSSLEGLGDYDAPGASGALVKCAVLCLGLVRYPNARAAVSGSWSLSTDMPLAQQLYASVGGSLEVELWSMLPQGSGLGTSSILAGTLLAAVAGVVGWRFDQTSLVHLVLILEQMLTTGGGWQDQVGGVYPGVKISTSGASLPLTVSVLSLGGVDSPLTTTLNSRLFLVYTGKTRLARDLLERVVRKWTLRDASVVDVVQDLRGNVINLMDSTERGDWDTFGKCINSYWYQKKQMGHGAEPPEVARILSALRSVCDAVALCGAGGGGFAYGFLKDGARFSDVISIVEGLKRSYIYEEPCSFHAISVDWDGLLVSVQE